MAKVKAVMFDIGDTLVPATSIASGALSVVANRLAADRGIDPDQLVAAYRHEDLSADGPTINHLWGLPTTIMEAACSSVGIPRTDALKVYAAYRQEVRAGIEASPKMDLLFGRLQAAGVQLAAVSNGTVIEQLDTLQILGVIDAFDSLVFSEDVGFNKPDSRMFMRAINDLGIAPSDCIFVGDDPLHDYDPAIALGMRALLIGERARNGDARITYLDDVLEYIAA